MEKRVAEAETDPVKIEISWPAKGQILKLSQDAEGKWSPVPRPPEKLLRGLQGWEQLSGGESDDHEQGRDVLIVEGDRGDALAVLARTHPRAVRMAYLDMPRIVVDDKTSAFSGIADHSYGTWLSLLMLTSEAVKSSMRRDGFVVVHVGDDESALARLVLDDVFGRDNHVGSIVWQKRYAPLGMREMRDLTAAHDTLHVFALDKPSAAAVGLRVYREDYSNPDDDPRGPWKADHKGAASRRESTDFDTFVPPYRWELVDGELPPGMWRASPLSGVLWGEKLTVAGDFHFTVRVSDSFGESALKTLMLSVREDAQPPSLAEIPWAFNEIETAGKLRVVTDDLPTGRVDGEYSAVLLAEGGTPFTDSPKRPTPPRWWEMAKGTLAKEYARDNVYFGRKGNSIPKIKQHDEGAVSVINQTTWWPGRAVDKEPFAGYTQDATKHLQGLLERGVIKEAPKTSKPLVLLRRLLQIFTAEGDAVLDVFGDAGDLGTAAIQSGRDAIVLRGRDERSQRLTSGCVIPRLVDAASVVPEDTDGVRIIHTRVGEWLARRFDGEDLIEVNPDLAGWPLREAVLTAAGFAPTHPDIASLRAGVSFDGITTAAYLEPEEHLTPERLALLVTSLAAQNQRLVIFYFRASEDLATSEIPKNVLCRRIPYELGI